MSKLLMLVDLSICLTNLQNQYPFDNSVSWIIFYGDVFIRILQTTRFQIYHKHVSFFMKYFLIAIYVALQHNNMLPYHREVIVLFVVTFNQFRRLGVKRQRIHENQSGQHWPGTKYMP